MNKIALWSAACGATLCGLTALADAPLTLIDPPYLTGTLRDFRAATDPGGHPDFESDGVNAVVPDAVTGQLGADRLPVFNNPVASSFHGTNAFDQWYRDASGVNLAKPFRLEFTDGCPGTARFLLRREAFFPVDGQLFGNDGRTHNYHFTCELHGEFTATDADFLNVKADDDLWIFVNGKRVIDLGGKHFATTASTNLDAAALGLSPNSTTNRIDVFFAERHTSESVLAIETNLRLHAPGAAEPLALPPNHGLALVEWTAGNGNWENATNWSPARVPGANDLALICNGAVVSLNTPTNVGGLFLGAGTLTHATGNTNGINLTALAAIHVAGAGRVDASGAGYAGGNQGSFGSSGTTRGPNGEAAAGSAGGGGGYGSTPSVGTVNPIYGSEVAPVDLGSGGSGSGEAFRKGGNGGGRIHLRAQSLVVDGSLLANGQRSFNYNTGADEGYGGGSGGSVFVELSGGTFSGSGSIEARGGASLSPTGVGGGGRIAIVGHNTNSFSGQLGRAGTSFVRAASSGGDLVLDTTTVTIDANTNKTFSSISSTPYGISYFYNYGTLAMSTDALVIGTNLVLIQDGVVKGSSRPDNWIGEIMVKSGGRMIHTQGNTNGVQLNVTGMLMVAAGGSIDVSALGYLGGQQPGNGSGAGRTRGANGQPAAGSTGGGGSYGSLSPAYAYGYVNPIYGSEIAPVDLGSGGAGDCCDSTRRGGNGGGHIHLRAQSLVVDGALKSNGGDSYNSLNGTLDGWGGGSGGSILVELSGGTFSGNGFIEAKGGVSSNPLVVGGGGRIAIIGQTTNTFSGQLGRAGTIFVQQAGTGGDLVLDTTTVTIDANTNKTFSSISSTPYGISYFYNYGTLAMSSDALVIGTNLVLTQDGTVKGANRTDNLIGSVTVRGGGKIIHTRGNTNGVQFNIEGALTVEANGQIDVSAAGYQGGFYPGNAFGGRGETRGPGGVPAAGSQGDSGGSYGSNGGGGLANPLYGSPTAPVDLGSGGASSDSSTRGGLGGGRMELHAHSLIVDGALKANGDASYRPSNGQYPSDRGGGSGGSIYVALSGGTFAGNGIIEARGGTSLSAGVVGGGGRISVSGHSITNYSGSMRPAARFTPPDGSGETKPINFTGSITGGSLYVNARPLPPVQIDHVINELTQLIVTNTATDLDVSNTLTYALLIAPAGATISSNGIIQWLPAESDGPSTNRFMTVVTDDAPVPLSATNSFIVFVNEVNVAPTLTVPANQSFNELTLFSAAATATDPDIPTNSLTFELVSGPAGLTVSPNGAIAWMPGEAQGPNSYLVTIRVVDDSPDAVNEHQLAHTNSFMLTVNEVNLPPSLIVPADQIIVEETPLHVSASASDADIPANPLRFALLSPPPGMAIDPISGAISWIPSEAQGSNRYTITVTVTDTNPPAINEKQFSATNFFMVTVNESNRPPALILPPTLVLDELTALSTNATATDPDFPVNPLTFALVSGPSNLTVTPAGGINWTPAEEQGPGSYQVFVSVTDTNPTAVNATSLSVTSSFSITVNEVNLPPVATMPSNQTIDELVAFAGNATALDADVPANGLMFELIDGPSGLTIAPAGEINWTPTESQGPSTNLVVVRLTDTNPPAVNTISFSVTNSFELIVREVNVAPVLTVTSNHMVNPGQTINFTATATDADVPTNALLFSLLDPPPGANISAGGVFTWRPGMALANTTNLIQVRVQDDGAPVSHDVKAFTVIVNPLGPVQLTPLGITNGQFNFLVSGTTGPDYVTETSSNLADWSSLATNFSAMPPFQIVDPAAFSNRAYRVRLQP